MKAGDFLEGSMLRASARLEGTRPQRVSPPRKPGLHLTVGRHHLATIALDTSLLAFSLKDILLGTSPEIPAVGKDGIFVRSVPISRCDELFARWPGMLVANRRSFAHRYIDMAGTFERYLSEHSGKTRSTLRRKVRRFAEANGGSLDVRKFTGPDGLADFLRIAMPLSRSTYQWRQLHAGLRDDAGSLSEMQALARQGNFRGFVLLLDGKAAAYLYLPIEKRTVIYGQLGFAPEWAALSPGTVLLFEALTDLFSENRFEYFDFTEGDSATKARFATGAVPCATFLLLRPNWKNRLVVTVHATFDCVVRLAKRFKRLARDARLVRARAEV